MRGERAYCIDKIRLRDRAYRGGLIEFGAFKIHRKHLLQNGDGPSHVFKRIIYIGSDGQKSGCAHNFDLNRLFSVICSIVSRE